MCAIIQVSRGEVSLRRQCGWLSKKCKKPLDNRHKVWYNEYVKRGTQGEPPLGTGGPTETLRIDTNID